MLKGTAAKARLENCRKAADNDRVQIGGGEGGVAVAEADSTLVITKRLLNLVKQISHKTSCAIQYCRISRSDIKQQRSDLSRQSVCRRHQTHKIHLSATILCY
jgi:hypothetical protein